VPGATRQPPAHCFNCGYELPEHLRCPECGKEHSEEDGEIRRAVDAASWGPTILIFGLFCTVAVLASAGESLVPCFLIPLAVVALLAQLAAMRAMLRRCGVDHLAARALPGLAPSALWPMLPLAAPLPALYVAPEFPNFAETWIVIGCFAAAFVGGWLGYRGLERGAERYLPADARRRFEGSWRPPRRTRLTPISVPLSAATFCALAWLSMLQVIRLG